MSGADEDDAHHHDLNMTGIYMHVLADTLGSVGVIISSLLIHFYDLYIADAICSIIISVMIVVAVMPLLREATAVLLQATPASKVRRIRTCLQRVPTVPGVVGCRKYHFWELCDGKLVGSLHIQVREDADEQGVLTAVNEFFSQSSLTFESLVLQLEKERFLVSLPPEQRMLEHF